ncbi:MAG: pseudaminic acid cytidylyltransferase, partial [Planctomycetota bacterium]
MHRIAVIPARGGSKRIPRKNIRSFCGRPMIAWSIAALCRSRLFDAVIVSTDDDEIMEVALSFGAEVPFRRPQYLADDHAPTLPVMQHALDWYETHCHAVDTLVCCYATAPFIQVSDIVESVNILEHLDAQWDYVLPVAEYPYPIQRALRCKGASLHMCDAEMMTQRSQDLEPSYHDAGQFYTGKSSAWRQQRPFFAGRSSAIILPRRRVVDIDTEEDWQFAE